MWLINNIKQFYFKYITTFLLLVIMVLIYLGVNGFDLVLHYMNAFGLAGLALFFMGLLSIVTNFGAFDFINYGFSKLFYRTKYRSLYDYESIQTGKRVKVRWQFVPYMFFSLISIITALILMMCFYL